jgi:glyoxylase-like metal-dependent hydrolase (beta-lactamase superfamily II)
VTAEDGVYALRYAFRTESFKGEHFHGYAADCHDRWPIDYFTWVIVQGGVPYVFDTGFTREEAERRGARTYLGSPVELLGELGFGAEDVPVVVLSHLHYDHTGHLADYPNARVVVQASELEFWEGPFSRRGAYLHLRPDADLRSLRSLVDAGRVDLLDGDAEVGPGITVHLVGGHTAGTQVVRVDAAEGPIVLASDASHFYANVDDDRPYGAVHHLDRMYAAFDTLHELAAGGVIVPGHDPLVVERHEALPSDPRIIRVRALDGRRS